MKRIEKSGFILTIIFYAFSISVLAQKPVTHYYYWWESYSEPIILDSLNNQGKKFLVEDYFKTPKINKMVYENEGWTSSDGIDTIDIHPCMAEEINISQRFFNVSLSKREKVKFEVYCNAKLKVSIDGKQVAEKVTEEDEMTDETKLLVEEELEPGNHIVGIAALCLFSKIVESGNPYYYRIKTLLYDGDTVGGEKDIAYSENLSGLTLKTMLCGENPYNVTISDSGDYYLVKYYNTDEKGKSTYRIEVRSSKDDKVVFTDNKNYSYSWFPKSNLLYYKDDSKIYFLNPKNLEKGLLIDEDGDIDGDITFIVLSDFDGYILSKVSKKDNTSDDLHRMYLPDDRIPGWRDRTELYLYTDFFNGKLFQTHRSTYLNDMYNEDSRILFSMTKDDITKRPFSFTSLYQYDIGRRKLDTIIENDGFVSSAQYLRDGENIVVLASNEAFNSIGSTVKKNQIPNAFNYSIYLMNLQTKKVEPVAKNFSPNVKDVIVREKNLYLTCENRDSVSVYRYNLKDKTFNLIPLPVDMVHSFDISDDETQMVFYGENYNKPKRLFHARQDTNKYALAMVKEVYFPKEQEYKKLSIGRMEKYSFRMHSSDIDGRLYYPADFDSTKKYPMIVYYYGGCSPTDRSFEMRYSAWLYTQQGYVVYVINPSGTTGWGQEFAARHVNAWGDYTADEIIEGVKRVCKAFAFIDEKHIGCMGASYGGFMTQYLQTKTDIFACAISHAGISNIASYWGEGYWGYSYSGAATADNYPWNNPELYTKHSPLFNADKIKTPLLLLHGTSDTNVPIGESIQMYNALKILGKEVEFITVKGENHGIVDFEKRLKWNNTIYAWFAKWLKEDASWWESLYPNEEY